jgi:hypothetical protein
LGCDPRDINPNRAAKSSRVQRFNPSNRLLIGQRRAAIISPCAVGIGERLRRTRRYHIPIPPQRDLPISYNIAPTQGVLAIWLNPETKPADSGRVAMGSDLSSTIGKRNRKTITRRRKRIWRPIGRLALQKDTSVIVPANVITIFAPCPRQGQYRLVASNRVGWCGAYEIPGASQIPPTPTTHLNLQGISLFSNKLGSVGGVGGATGWAG